MTEFYTIVNDTELVDAWYVIPYWRRFEWTKFIKDPHRTKSVEKCHPGWATLVGQDETVVFKEYLLEKYK